MTAFTIHQSSSRSIQNRGALQPFKSTDGLRTRHAAGESRCHPLPSRASHVRVDVSRFTSLKEIFFKKEAPEGEAESERKRSAFSPRSTSCHSQWASSAWEPTKHGVTSNHEFVIKPSCPPSLQPYWTKTHIKKLNETLFTNSFKMSSKTCLLRILDSFFSFIGALVYILLPQQAVSIGTVCLCLLPGNRLDALSEVLRKGQCVMGEASSTVSHCFGHRMTHRRQIRAGGIWERTRPLH